MWFKRGLVLPAENPALVVRDLIDPLLIRAPSSGGWIRRWSGTKTENCSDFEPGQCIDEFTP